jgi:hypothetical protein
MFENHKSLFIEDEGIAFDLDLLDSKISVSKHIPKKICLCNTVEWNWDF